MYNILLFFQNDFAPIKPDYGMLAMSIIMTALYLAFLAFIVVLGIKLFQFLNVSIKKKRLEIQALEKNA